jgi:hypothetical protein
MIDSIKASIGRRLHELNTASEEDFTIDMSLAEYPITLEKGMDVAHILREASESLADALKPGSGSAPE